MPRRLTLVVPVLLSGVLLSGPSFAAPASYTATGGRVNFAYNVTFIGVRGSSDALTAEATFAPDNLPKASGRVVLAAAALRTGNGVQEGHMRGALGADRFPDIVYSLTAVNSDTMLREGQTLATTGSGSLTLKGKTRVLTVPLKLTLNGGKVNVATQFKFNPHEYGVDYFGGADSIAIDVNFVLSPR